MKCARRQTCRDPKPATERELPPGYAAIPGDRRCAFTLIELLVVISIMGLIAALAVPALKNLGKSNIQASAARQMLDDVGRARQLAISQHTAVYMIFVRTNFWLEYSQTRPGLWLSRLTPAQMGVLSNLCDKQLTGYTFVSLRSVGDQPGQGRCRYLAPWQALPDGTFIAPQKFQMRADPLIYYPIYGINNTYQIHGFYITNTIPFPTEDSVTPGQINLQSATFAVPYIAFNYLGQLTADGQTMVMQDEYIPLAQGTVSAAINGATKAPVLGDVSTSPQISEVPPGNSTNTMYNIIHIDHVTGRATLEYQHVQ